MRHQNDKIYIQNQLFLKKGPPIPDGLQQEAREFIDLCLKPDPEERKSARELLNEAYPRVRIGKILDFLVDFSSIISSFSIGDT